MKELFNRVQSFAFLEYFKVCFVLPRRLEAKFDAKSLWPEAISIRCATPPAQRRVPIQFDGWIVVAENSKDSNWFMSSQLVQDRQVGVQQ